MSINSYLSDSAARDISKIPSVRELKKNLKKLREMNLSGYSLERIEAKYFERAYIIPNAVQILPSKGINLFTPFRVRRGVKSTESLENFRTFSYPDAKWCLYNGRAKVKGTTVFYCADAPHAAIFESRLSAGEICYLGVWSIKSDKHSFSQAFMPHTVPIQNLLYSYAIDQRSNMFSKQETEFPSVSEQLAMIYDFVADVFANESEPYSLSSWLADKALYTNKLDYIIYPSFQTRQRTCNFAFSPAFVDDFFQLEKVFELKVMKATSTSIEQNLLRTGIQGPTKIIWRDPIDEDYLKISSKAKIVDGSLVIE